MGGSREKKEIFVESVFICLFYLRLFYMDLTVVRSRTMWFSGLVLVANSIILTKMVEDKKKMGLRKFPTQFTKPRHHPHLLCHLLSK